MSDRGDAPATPPAGLRHRLEYGLFRVARTVLNALPEAVAVRVAAALGWLAGVVLRIRRADVDRHLGIAFPDRPAPWRHRVARASYVHLAREAAVLFRMPRWSAGEIADRVRFVNFDPVLEAAAGEHGVVLLTAHLGNWEIAGAGIAASGLPLDVVGKGMSNRRFEEELFSTRARLGMNVIEMSDAPRGVLRSLGRGRMAALLGDQNARKGGLFLPFFGREASTHRGPAIFALRRDAPVFVGFAIREPGWSARYVLEAHELNVERTGDLETDVTSVLRAYHEILESAIVSAPEQYFWHHRRWKTRPGTEAGGATDASGTAHRASG